MTTILIIVAIFPAVVIYLYAAVAFHYGFKTGIPCAAARGRYAVSKNHRSIAGWNIELKSQQRSSE